MPSDNYTCWTTLSQCEICFNGNWLGFVSWSDFPIFIYIDALRKRNPTSANTEKCNPGLTCVLVLMYIGITVVDFGKINS